MQTVHAINTPPVQRHSLVWLHDVAWHKLLGQSHWDAQARACLTHWQRHQLPLVVARQPKALPDFHASHALIHLGLPMPNRWARGRLSLAVQSDSVRAWGAFPLADAIAPLLPPHLQASWQRLCAQWQKVSCAAQVYGGYGWQTLSGVPYLRATSDLDVLLPVRDADHADHVVQSLWAFSASTPQPRLDGELLFPDHAAVNWREWQHWRSGQAQVILVKRIASVELHQQPWWKASTTKTPAQHTEEPAHVRA